MDNLNEQALIAQVRAQIVSLIGRVQYLLPEQAKQLAEIVDETPPDLDNIGDAIDSGLSDNYTMGKVGLLATRVQKLSVQIGTIYVNGSSYDKEIVLLLKALSDEVKNLSRNFSDTILSSAGFNHAFHYFRHWGLDFESPAHMDQVFNEPNTSEVGAINLETGPKDCVTLMHSYLVTYLRKYSSPPVIRNNDEHHLLKMCENDFSSLGKNFRSVEHILCFLVCEKNEPSLLDILRLIKEIVEDHCAGIHQHKKHLYQSINSDDLLETCKRHWRVSWELSDKPFPFP